MFKLNLDTFISLLEKDNVNVLLSYLKLTVVPCGPKIIYVYTSYWPHACMFFFSFWISIDWDNVDVLYWQSKNEFLNKIQVTPEHIQEFQKNWATAVYLRLPDLSSPSV